ncbi:MAG: sugar porter family MFS transporter [Bacteroidales bacterium]|nr:sugar porter family MFS transporter [Bacteroidales bacterium]
MNSKVLRWSLIVALGGFLFGFDTAVISGVEKSIQQLFNLNSSWHGFTISSALIGTVIGALTAGKPADKYGRRIILFYIAGLYTISAFGSAMSSNLWLFIFFRFIGGLAVGASSVAGPMYISEISPADKRGRMTALFQFNVIFGIMMAYISNYLLTNTGAEPWRYMLGVEGVPAILFFVLLFAVPRSPRFLIKTGRNEEAKRVLLMIDPDDVDNQIRDIQQSLKDGKSSARHLFDKAYFKPITIAFLVAMFNQFSGINAILYYAPRIFEMTGLSKTISMFQPVIIGITNGLFTILGLVIIDKVGRKPLLIVGSIGMSLCLGLISRAFYLQDFTGYSILILLVVYIIFFAFSTGAVIWVLIAEVFPNRVRGQGQSLGSFTHWFFAALITFIFPVIVESGNYGNAFAFGFFSVMMIVQAVIVWKFFPETKGKSLEKLGEEMSGKL